MLRRGSECYQTCILEGMVVCAKSKYLIDGKYYLEKARLKTAIGSLTTLFFLVTVDLGCSDDGVSCFPNVDSALRCREDVPDLSHCLRDHLIHGQDLEFRHWGRCITMDLTRNNDRVKHL